MNITVLGCSGSIAGGCKTTSFLIDDDVLIDAGTGVGDLSLNALARINHIFISHSHLDHVVSIGLLADSVLRLRVARERGPIRVMALPETLAALRTHILNGVIWPDFTRLPSPEQPALEFVPFAQGDVIALGSRRVEVLSAAHTVPAVGFAAYVSAECDHPAIDTSGTYNTATASTPSNGPKSHGPVWVYTGDTGPNPELWARLRSTNVAYLVIETAFGDEECELASISGHLCPSLLAQELKNLSTDTQVYITHIKPGELGTVMGQVAALELPHRITALEAGTRWTVGAV